MKIEIANKEEFIEEIAEKVFQNMVKRILKVKSVASITKEELTTLDVQHYFGVSGATVRNWRLNGYVTYKQVNRKYYYSRDNILERLAEGVITTKLKI